jgi:ABC-type transport system involved in cytochrome bd biosynthesis fused ATPase/permease subunit
LRSSDLLGRITVDSDAVENQLLRSVFPKVGVFAALVAVGVFFSLLFPALAAVALSGLLLTVGVLVVLAGRQAGAPARVLVASRARARQEAIEMLDGLPELRSFGAERRAAAEVTDELDQLARSRRHLSVLEAGGRAIGLLLADFTLLVVAIAAAGLIGDHRLSAPWFVAACLVAIAVFEPIVGLSAAITAGAKGRAAATRLAELFPESPSAEANAPLARSLAVDLAQQLTPSSIVLLTGPSGSGKSTILRRIAECSSGSVTLIAQDAYVFDGTIRENLLLAFPGATDAQLWDALRAAAFDHAVAEFPWGLDTPVGPAGEQLSGGQRRRLTVAMGLLRRPSVLLLDEPTEGLDTQTAARLLCGVRAHDSTAAIVIALHDRQSLDPPWAPTARIELA